MAVCFAAVSWAMCAGAARVRPDGEARALAGLWGYCGYTTLVRGVWTLPLEVPIRRRRL